MHKIAGIVLGSLLLVVSCNQDKNKNSVSSTEDNSKKLSEDSGSPSEDNESPSGYSEASNDSNLLNIPYLKSNHNKYKKTGSNELPVPEKNEADLKLTWKITAENENSAIKLYNHITFMVDKIQEGNPPRPWDKLFLLESYLKISYLYTTKVTRSNVKNIVVVKQAVDSCAYKVIEAHSDAVSGDFFSKGVINNDYSSVAESIINTVDCEEHKDYLENYILQNQTSKGHGGKGHGSTGKHDKSSGY